MNQRSFVASGIGLASAVVVAVACGGKSAPPAEPIANDTAVTPAGGGAEPGLPAGVTDGALWTCQISFYDPQPCKFHREGNEWRLTKLLGSQRFDGVVTFGDGGFRFVGHYFCPWGACDEAMDLTFAPAGDHYEAQVDGDVIAVGWSEPLASEWGGAGYGNLTGREQ